ncbi:Hint domain-containing protein [Ovoidimarina sediminis]|uniref:Hint domain-containing protein n=1 Tax=Ovoidimarina sediminis TaxID=3079856 RepID=UPI00290C90CE|nr:Hint domain-containing protein [Rhodophyticola sp. MJ-SS7]MDU8945161.1 Hint domain-containing protein [Rhodophyticola sp. MJ-SS7]
MPTSFTFYARGDSSTANNGAVNSQNTITVPVTELRFEAADGGDVLLDYNDGASDPDTILYVDGVETTFTVEFTGTLPLTGKYSDINGLDLRGEEVLVITDDSTGQRYYFLTDQMVSVATMEGFPNGSIQLENVNETPPPVAICFASGTGIDTPMGPRPVEEIAPGDIVMTDLGPRAVRWVGKRKVTAAEMDTAPMLRPITIAAGAIAPGVPSAPVTISANHRIQVSGWALELALGQPQALVAAKHLLHRPGITQGQPEDGVSYVHLMFDSHRLVTTSGLVSESFEPGPVGLATLDPLARREVARVPVALDAPSHGHPSLKRHEARTLEALA